MQIRITVSKEEPPTPLCSALLMVDRGMSTAKANCRTLRYCREISSRTNLVRLSISDPHFSVNNFQSNKESIPRKAAPAKRGMKKS